MIRTRSISSLALATMLVVACSETGTEPTQIKRYDLRDDVCTKGCASLSSYPKTLVLGSDQLIVFVLKGVSLPNGSKVTAGGTAPSDTVPGPLPPAPVGKLLRTVEGVHQLNIALVSAGLVAPSDTVPGPRPGGPGTISDYLGSSTAVMHKSGAVVILASSSDLVTRGIIGPEFPALKLNVLKGNQVLFTGGTSFGIISPERK